MGTKRIRDVENNIQEFLEMESSEKSSFIKTNRQDIFYHQVSLDSEVGDASQYRDLINLLYMADENVEFNIFINSPGGNLMSALAIIEAIKATQSVVRAIITGECHSAASLLAMSCHEVIVTDSAHSLIHTASYGTEGNTHMIQRHVEFSTKMINRVLDNAYQGFLSVEELSDVKRGIEMWMDAEEIRARMDGRRAYLVNLKELQEKEVAKEVVKAAKAKATAKRK